MDSQPNNKNPNNESAGTFGTDTPSTEPDILNRNGVAPGEAPDDDMANGLSEVKMSNSSLSHGKTITPDIENANSDENGANSYEAHVDEPRDAESTQELEGTEQADGLDTNTDESRPMPVDDAQAEEVSAVEAESQATKTGTQPALDNDMYSESDQPVTRVSAGGFSPQATKSKWWNRKHTILVAVIAVVIVVLFGGTALAYKVWYQAPSKVLSDASINFISAQSMTYTGSLNVTSGTTKLALAMDGGGSGSTASMNLDAKLDSDGTKFEVPLSLVGNAQTFYFKLSNLQALESQFITPYLSMGGLSAADQAKVDTLVKDIDGTWYRVTPDDLSQSTKDKQTGQCLQNVITDIRTNSATQRELKKVYAAHPLFMVEKALGGQSGSLGYAVKPVSDKDAKGFVIAFKNTSTYKSLVKCDSSVASAFNTDTLTSTSTANEPTINVWVSRWSHQLTKITSSTDSNGTKADFTFTPNVGAKANVAVPKNAKSIKDLENQFTSVEESLGIGGTTDLSASSGAATTSAPQNQVPVKALVQAQRG